MRLVSNPCLPAEIKNPPCRLSLLLFLKRIPMKSQFPLKPVCVAATLVFAVAMISEAFAQSGSRNAVPAPGSGSRNVAPAPVVQSPAPQPSTTYSAPVQSYVPSRSFAPTRSYSVPGSYYGSTFYRTPRYNYPGYRSYYRTPFYGRRYSSPYRSYRNYRGYSSGCGY